MKKLNLIKRLWTDSHEKQKPQRFGRYAVMLMMLLTLGVGQMWAYDPIDVYCAIDDATLGSYNLRCNYNGYGGASDHWIQCVMTNTGYTYNGKLLYKGTFTPDNSGANYLQFQLYNGDTWVAEYAPINNSWIVTNTFAGKINEYGQTTWNTYGYDIYYVNTNNWGSVYAYAYNSESDKNADWPGAQMTKTDKTYEGHDIYRVIVTKTYAKVIFNCGSDACKTSDLTLGAKTSSQVYNNGNWYPYPTWYWIIGNGAQNGSENFTKQVFQETATVGVYTLTRNITQGETFHIGNGTYGYGPSSNTNVTGTSSDLALTQYGPVYWYTFISTSRSVIFTLNTNNMTLSLASAEEYAINYYDEGGSSFSGEHGVGYPTKHTYGSETALVSPTKTGYVFEGWYTNSSCTGDPVTSLGATDYDDAISLYAKWTALPIVYIMKSKDPGCIVPHGFEPTDNNASELKLWAWKSSGGTTNFYNTSTYPWPGKSANQENDVYEDGFGNEWYRFIPDNTSDFDGSTSYSLIVTYGGGENGNKIFASDISEGRHIYTDGVDVGGSTSTVSGTVWIIPKGSTGPNTAILYTENPATLLWSLHSNGLKVGDFDKIGEDTYQLTVLASAITNYGAVCFSYNGENYKLGNCSLHTEYYSPETAETLIQDAGNFNWTGSPTGQIILTIFKSSGDWKIYYTPSYQVTYDANGATTGSVPTDANYYTSGTSVTIEGNSGNLVKTGYNFAGWNGNASGTGTDYTPAGTFSITGNTTLYAKWTPKNFSITYKDQGDAAFSGAHASGYPTSHTYNTATALKSASKTGYTFDGWFTNSACTGSAVTELGATDYKADIVLYAKWTINNHGITRTVPSNGSLSIKVGSADAVNTNTTSDYNETVVLTTTPNFGYYLTSLTVTKSDDPSTVVSVSNNTFTMPDYNVTITATYALRYGLIGQAADGENHGMPGTEVASAADFTFSNPNLVCARNLDPNTTYLFKVYDRVNSASRGYTTENTVLESGSSLQLSGTYDLKLNTAGRGEYTFKITAVTNNAEAYPTVTVDRPTSYELTLKHGNAMDGHSYGGTVTATATESGTATAITDGQYVAAGGSIAFTTTVPSGYTFGGWYSDDDYETEIEEGANIEITDDGEGTHTLTISSIAADVAVYAKYTGNTYTLSYDATTNGGDRIDDTKTVTMGRAYGDLPTAYKYGYTFLGWYTAPSDGTKVTAETIVTIASNHTIYAQFQEISYVYFYNNLGWSEVYATFNAYWNEDGKGGGNDLGTGNYGRPYYQMELVEGSANIYRCQIPAYLTDKDWQYNIAFNNQKKLSKEDPLPTTGDWNNFNSGKAVFRRDFDSYATMFVPDPTETVVSKNGVQYYSTDQWVDHQDNDPAKAIIDYRYTKGYWRKYNPNDYSDTYAGYVIKGSWDGEKHDYYFKRTAGLLGTDTFSVTVHLDKGQTYNFRIYKHCKTNNTYSSWLIQNSGNTITRTITDADNYTLNMAIAKSETDKKDHITATVAGEYTFKLACGRDGVLQLLVDYPEIAADGNWYRALYTWVDKSSVTHTRVCKTFRRIDNSGTTWFEAFIHKSDAVTSRSLKLQKCTGITSNEPAWTDVVGGGITLSDADITETGVYTFTVTRNKNQQPTGSFNEKYDGVYYIRTDATEGGWDYYNSFGGYKMDYSAYSLTQTLSEPYSHYYCKFVDNTTTSVAFTVATYNSPSICDTLKNTDGIVTDTYSFLPAKANVRFSYNEQTNALTRAYLKPATGDGNARYLVLHGQDTKVMDKDGSTIAKKGDGAEDMKANELLFSDEGDWIYSVTLKASPVAKASLIARYNGADRYLIGGAESYETILGGTESDTKYTLQATYNFKTNRLLMAWKPEGENISEALANVDMLWVRHAQDAAKEIKFTGSGSLSSIKVVGALEFDFDELYGKVGSWNTETRRLIKFFISLPFDVAISDIFGLHEAEYGEAFIVQKYNGAKRAKNGLFAQDENTFWETLTVDSVMHANEGYCLMMDNYYMHGTQGSIWENKGSGSKVYLYLPSTGSIGSITAGTQTISLPAHPCEIERTFTPEGGSGTVSHKNTDANWNFMGVPLFSSYTGEATSGYPGAIFVTADAGEGQGYLYKWNYSTNNYNIYAGTGFEFQPMHSYLVQFAGNVTFSGSRIPASVAARQHKSETNYNVDLQVLNTDNEMVNRTYVELRENACDTFLLNEDLYLVTNSQPVNVFSFAGNYTVGANVLSVNNHIVPLGLIVRQNGTYTFSMPSNFSGTVTLLDTYAQTRTNLALEDYELYLERGTINDRFFLEININNAPTAIDGVTDGSGSLKDGKAHKFIENGVMYILKDGEVFDARGNRVK